jgi:hypothetical protein
MENAETNNAVTDYCENLWSSVGFFSLSDIKVTGLMKDSGGTWLFRNVYICSFFTTHFQ